MDPKETQGNPAADPATPGTPTTQPGTPAAPDSGAAPATPPAAPRKYAGKYETPEELEAAYKSAETKIGAKSFAEGIGEKIVQATGYSAVDLQAAGYSSEQIVQAMLNAQNTGVQAPPEGTPAHAPVSSTADVLRSTVENSRYAKLEWNDKKRDFFAENPDAKEFRDELDEFHAMPQYRDLPPEELFGLKLKKFLKKGEAITEQRHTEKEKASMSFTPTTVPDADPAKTALDRYRKNPKLDNAESFMAARMRSWREKK